MEALKIRKFPDPILRARCAPVKEVTDREAKLFEDMVFTMHNLSGIGLAAPQVGEPRQLIVADVGEGIIKLANPRIVKVKGKDKMCEGCLSIPDVNIDIKRAYEVTVIGLNERGESQEIKAQGLLARVLQHEIDHLKGRLIIDYVSLIDKLLKRKGVFPRGAHLGTKLTKI